MSARFPPSQQVSAGRPGNQDDLKPRTCAETEPFLDDFENGNATGWSLGTDWSASTKVIKETNATSTRFHRALGQNDVDIRFRYMTTDTTAGLFGEMCFRTSSTNALTNNTVLRMSTDGMKLQKVVAGVVTVLDSEATATATANTWYRVRILAKGANVTVWRGEGDDGPMEEVLSSSAVPTLTTVSMWFISGANAAFAYDDIAIVANGWTSDTTFATNSGNELTSSTFGGVTTTYGYGGDGKRRERTAGGTTLSYRWAEGYQAQSEQVGSDASTRRTHIGGLAHFDTATASDGTYRYYGADHLGSTRAAWESDRDLASAYEYGPYGTPYSNFGPGTTHRYTGHDWDASLGGYYAPFRYYSPGMARWMSRDPLGMVDGPNLWGYVSQNPVNASDPEGLMGSNGPVGPAAEPWLDNNRSYPQEHCVNSCVAAFKFGAAAAWVGGGIKEYADMVRALAIPYGEYQEDWAKSAFQESDFRYISAELSATVPANKWTGLTQHGLSQWWQTQKPSGMGPTKSSYTTLCARFQR